MKQIHRGIPSAAAPAWVAGILLALIAPGCRDDQQAFFAPEHQIRDLDRTMIAQAAAGARADAMLHPLHFDDAQLNSLGQSKLNLMMKDLKPDQLLVLYMNLAPDDPAAKGRNDSVRNYLQGRGLTSTQIDLRQGPNPASCNPAAPGLARMGMTESGAAPAANYPDAAMTVKK